MDHTKKTYYKKENHNHASSTNTANKKREKEGLTWGIDLGTSSIGLSIIDKKENKLIDLFVSTIPNSTKSTDDKSPNQVKQDARRRRIGTQRHARRIRKLIYWLAEQKLFPPIAPHISLKRELQTLQYNGNEVLQKYMQQDPYLLRKEALEGKPLTPFQLGRILLHIAQRRGFPAYKLLALKEGGEATQIAKGDQELQEAIKKTNSITLGAYLSTQKQNAHPTKGEKIRGHYTFREMYADELKHIWHAQQNIPHHPHAILFQNQELYHTISQVKEGPLFGQRALKKKQRRRCDLEPERPRTFRSHPIAEEKTWYEFVNHLTYDGEPLTSTAKNEVIQYIKNQQGRKTIKELRKALKLENTTLNYQDDHELPSNASTKAFCNLLGYTWDTFPLSTQKEIWQTLLQLKKQKEPLQNLTQNPTLQSLFQNTTLQIHTPKTFTPNRKNNGPWEETQQAKTFLESLRIEGNPLKKEQKTKLHGYLLDTKTPNLKGLLKKLNTKKELTQNKTPLTEKDSLPTYTNTQLVRNIFGYTWETLTPQEKEARWHILDQTDDFEWLATYMEKKWHMRPLHIQEALNKNISLPQGTAAYSLKALRHILPFLKNGYHHHHAVILGGIQRVLATQKPNLHEDHAFCQTMIDHLQQGNNTLTDIRDHLTQNFGIPTKILDKLYDLNALGKYKGPLLNRAIRPKTTNNPTVDKVLNQTRILVNALLATYGNPQTIYIEYARLKTTEKKKAAIKNQQGKNRKANLEATAFLQEKYQKRYISAKDIRKYLLWEEQDHTCLYCEKVIGFGSFKAAQIDHIVPQNQYILNKPYNQVLACPACNLKKSNQTPFQAFGKRETAWKKMKQTAKAILGKKNPKKYQHFISTTTHTLANNEFAQRELTNTAFIAREVNYMLGSICQKVYPLQATHTAYIRKKWHLNKLLNPSTFDDQKTFATIRKLAQISPHNELEGNYLLGLDHNDKPCFAIPILRKPIDNQSLGEQQKKATQLAQKQLEQAMKAQKTDKNKIYPIEVRIFSRQKKTAEQQQQKDPSSPPQKHYYISYNKQREDHRHHAIDAFVIANSTHALLLKYSKIENPRPSQSQLQLIEQLKGKINALTIFRKTTQKTFEANKPTLHNKIKIHTAFGALHEETFYGKRIRTQYLPAQNSYTQQEGFHTKENIENIKKNKINQIADPQIQHFFTTLLQVFEAKEKALQTHKIFLEKEPALTHFLQHKGKFEGLFMPDNKNGISLQLYMTKQGEQKIFKKDAPPKNGALIKSIRIFHKGKKPVQIDKKYNKYALTGNNQYLAIYEFPNGKWQAKVYSLLESVKRKRWESLPEKKKKEEKAPPEVPTLFYKGAPLTMVLQKGDMILLGLQENPFDNSNTRYIGLNQHLYVVTGFSDTKSGNISITLLHHTAATDKNPFLRRIIQSPNTFKKENPIPVIVTPLGEIKPRFFNS